LLFLVSSLFLLSPLVLVLFFLQGLQRLEERFAALFVEDGGDGDEFAGVVPFVVSEEDVQGVEF
jgi:hypothetical protein